MTMMNFDNDSKKLRDTMVMEIIETGITSANIIHAFSLIPREKFVPTFLQKVEGQWMTISPTTDSEYLQKIYINTSLVVQVDHRGWPCSSSSMPSVMATMLEALKIKPGNKVLEVGTGTGYNAAIMSFLTQDAKLVTTIDHSAASELSNVAKETLHALVGHVHVIVGDGFQGFPEHAPYDRILATASTPTIPEPWIEQLAPDGILVMDLQGTLESGFLVFTKNNHDEGGTGTFLKRQLHFMPLISEQLNSIYVDTRFLLLLQQANQKRFNLDNDSIVRLLLEDHHFRWFFQWYLPNCNIVEMNNEDGHRVFVVNYAKESILQLKKDRDGWSGDVFGEYKLWDMIQEALQIFKQIGEPQPTDYTVEVGGKINTISAKSFSLPLK